MTTEDQMGDDHRIFSMVKTPPTSLQERNTLQRVAVSKHREDRGFTLRCKPVLSLKDGGRATMNI